MITQNAELFKKAPSWLYKTAAQLYIDKEFPRHLFVETTASCNLLCDYCPREKVKNHMDFNLFRSIIDEATHYGPRSFSLHLFGEPLLYPHVWESINYIKKKNKRHTILLTSNGTLFERFADPLFSSRVDKVIWSWRPEAKFSPEFKERLKRWGKLSVRLIKEVVPKEEMEYWSKWPSVEIRSLHNYGGNIDVKNWISPVVKTDTKSQDKRWPCYHLFYAPAVAWNGNILICCSDPHQKEIMGKFPKTRISEAWKNMDKVRKAHLEGKYEGICANCDVWKSYPNAFFGHEYLWSPQ